ncbi:IS4 family transposase ISRso13 [Methylobacterium crusticola]|uniref:IS4 family transposase ISRso13 n=1 Tax=Methylobacterium crusticola TaxID=1697972 RepID=A0ABQ4R8N3_9HYPH|nr:IS4 family transposase [Methylobacterium crusticola]GJD54102.1 IS4 family transposase ISRso13 [Methylobacterium crusticola]
MLGEVFERFVAESPISVMVRASLERVLGADRLDLWFAHTAQKQYTRDLLFSSIDDLMNQVVFCVNPSVRAAYQAQQDDEGTSLVSVYNKLNNIETHTAAELVRYRARELTPLIEHMGGERAPWHEGYRIKIVAGNCIEASEHRIKELRQAKGRALPGKSLVVYEPAQGLVTDVFPCENGHAQERSLFGPLLKTVQPKDLWIEDRNFCTRDVLCEIDNRGAFFVTREHRGLDFKILGPLRSYGRTSTGESAQQRIQVMDAQGNAHGFRRLRIKLKEATRDGATIIHIVTNLPRQVSAKHVAQLYQNRWKVETAFQHLEAYFHSEINTLGYPKAALFGFCLALVAYNLLAVVLAALRGVHGAETVDEEVSLYYIANEIATTYHGIMIAIPAPEWDIFYSMRLADLAAILLELARGIRLQTIRKSPRRPKKPRPQGNKPARKGHVSTAKLLMNRKAKSATP